MSPPTEAKADPDVSDPSTAAPVLASDEQDGMPRPELRPLRLGLLILGISVGLFLAFLDSSIVATSLFDIGTEFGDLEQINWVALAYTLSYLGFAVFFARISDIVGRRNAFVLSYVIFIAFSIGCGFANSMNQLIACRALQGLGGSGLYSITMIVLPEIAPPRMAQMIAGLIGIVITISSVLGPVLGGILTHYATWRWVFWINGPIGAASLVLFIATWPKAEYLPDLERRTWKELDYLGSVLLIAAAILVVFPFQNVSEDGDQWSQAVFIAPIVVGSLCWLALGAWCYFVELRWGDRLAAAIPLRLIRNRVYASAALNTMFLGFPYMMVIYAFPLRLQVVNGKSALIAGDMLLPMLGSSALGSVISGAINGKKDRSFATLLAASCFMIIGCGLLTTVSGSYVLEAKALGFLVFVGLGFGLSVSTTTMIGSLQSSIQDHATAQGLVAQVRVLGGSLGIAASSAILGVVLQRNLGGSVSSQDLSSIESGDSSHSPQEMEAIRQVYAEAFKEDMQVCAIVTGIGILIALGTFPQNRMTVEERMAQRAKEEKERRMAKVSSRALQD